MIKKIKAFITKKCIKFLNRNPDYLTENVYSEPETKQLYKTLTQEILSHNKLIKDLVEDPRLCKAVAQSSTSTEYILSLPEVTELVKSNPEVIAKIANDDASIDILLAHENAINHICSSRALKNQLPSHPSAILGIVNDKFVRQCLFSDEVFISSFLSDQGLMTAIKNTEHLLTKLIVGTEWKDLLVENEKLIREVSLNSKIYDAIFSAPELTRIVINDDRLLSPLCKAPDVLSKIISRNETVEVISESQEILKTLMQCENSIPICVELVASSPQLSAALSHSTNGLLNLLSHEPVIDFIAQSNKTLERVLVKKGIAEFIKATPQVRTTLFKQSAFHDAVVKDKTLMQSIIKSSEAAHLLSFDLNEHIISILLDQDSSRLVERLCQEQRFIETIRNCSAVQASVISNEDFPDALLTHTNYSEMGDLLKQVITSQPMLLEIVLNDDLIRQEISNSPSLGAHLLDDSAFINRLGWMLSTLDDNQEQHVFSNVDDLIEAPIFWNAVTSLIRLASQSANSNNEYRHKLLKLITHDDFLELICSAPHFVKTLFESQYINQVAIGRITHAEYWKDSHTLTVSGWYMPQIDGDEIKLFDEDSNYIGNAVNRIIRPDLYNRFPIFTELKSGFSSCITTDLPLPEKVTVQVWRDDKVVLSMSSSIELQDGVIPNKSLENTLQQETDSVDLSSATSIKVKWNQKTLINAELFRDDKAWLPMEQLRDVLSRSTNADFAECLSVELKNAKNQLVEYTKVSKQDHQIDHYESVYLRVNESIMQSCTKDREFYASYMRGNRLRIYADLDVIEPFLNPEMKFLDIGGNPPLLGGMVASVSDCSVYVADPQTDIFKDYYDAEGINAINMDLLALKNIDKNLVEQFDFVAFCEVFEHLTGDLIKTTQKVVDVIRPGGYLYLTTPNLSSISGFVSLLSEKSGIPSKNPEDVYAQYEKLEKYGYFGHVREYSAKETTDFLANFDLELVHSSMAPDYRERHGQNEMTKLAKSLEHVVPNSGLFGKYLFKKVLGQ